MKNASFLAQIVKPADSVTGVFFQYPDTKLEVEIIPIDTVERRRIYGLCEIKNVIPGFREKETTLDVDKHDRMIAEKGIGRLRGATVGCLKKIILIDPALLEAGLRAKLNLPADKKITDDMEVPLGPEDAMYLFTTVPKFKLWVDHCQGRTDVYNAAQKSEELGN